MLNEKNTIQNNVCWVIIIKYFIGLLTGLVSASNHTKCVSLRN